MNIQRWKDSLQVSIATRKVHNISTCVSQLMWYLIVISRDIPMFCVSCRDNVCACVCRDFVLWLNRCWIEDIFVLAQHLLLPPFFFPFRAMETDRDRLDIFLRKRRLFVRSFFEHEEAIILKSVVRLEKPVGVESNFARWWIYERQ